MSEKILQDLDIDRVSERIKWFVDHTPYRIAGSDDEARAADYVAHCLREYGLETRNDTFYAFNSFPLYSQLELLVPEQRLIPSLPCAHIRSTARDGEKLELIYVGSGSYEDYQAVDPRGKAVLVEVSYSPPVPEKARIASELGAAAILCMNWGNDEPVICNRGLKAVWGNPTEETAGHIPHLAGISIRRSDGLALKELCQRHDQVTIRLAAIAEAKWSQIHQPIGVLHGNGKSDQFIVVGAHLDAWQPGVTCNATGNATALELCRVLSQYRERLDRDIWFVFWNGHEIAEAAGSTWFVDHYWDALNKNGLAYVNIDSTGLGDAVLYEVKASDELYDFTYRNARAILPPDMAIRMMGLPKIGDQSFFGIGVPSTAQRMSYTDEYIKSSHGVTLGWWNHTSEDGYDKYSPDNIRHDLRVTASLLYHMARARTVPYLFERKFKTIEDKLEVVSAQNQGRLSLGDLMDNLHAAKKNVLAIQSRRETLGGEQVELYNDFMLSVSRLLTNVFQTYADKYQQDSYGHTHLSSPIPLFSDLGRLSNLDPGSFAYGMIETQLIKNKNRINDALTSLTQLSGLYERLIFGGRGRKY